MTPAHDPCAWCVRTGSRGVSIRYARGSREQSSSNFARRWRRSGLSAPSNVLVAVPHGDHEADRVIGTSRSQLPRESRGITLGSCFGEWLTMGRLYARRRPWSTSRGPGSQCRMSKRGSVPCVPAMRWIATIAHRTDVPRGTGSRGSWPWSPSPLLTHRRISSAGCSTWNITQSLKPATGGRRTQRLGQGQFGEPRLRGPRAAWSRRTLDRPGHMIRANESIRP
jgi:hypothetical protein